MNPKGNKRYDVVIIGGGVMGCATAYSLMSIDPGLSIAVVERDPTYTHASTPLSVANVRAQFSLANNVKISLYAIEVLKGFDRAMAVEDQQPAIGFKQEGNLFLVDAQGRETARQALAMQRELGAQVEWWTPVKIGERYPLYRPEPLAGGTFGAADGHFDAYAVLMGYRAKAKYLGAHFLTDKAELLQTAGSRVCGVRLASGQTLATEIAVNCAGAWCARFALSAGIELPVVPVKRQVFALSPAEAPDRPLPLTVLPSGLYFRTETGGLIIVGKSMPEDPEGIDFNWDQNRFYEQLWPELAEFVPAFERLKLMRGWAGLYAVNRLDNNAILGEWPELAGFYMANGFSGHGLQQAPAVGRYLAELITGASLSLDLSIFSPRRILEQRPLSEDGIV
jgi:glycine/D-amino acid oxidase-like deaminating enzyme